MSVSAVTRFTTFAVLASAALASTASAQGFQAMPATFNNVAATNPAPVRPFFDNLSDDGVGCNVGFLLSNAPGVSSTCANQRPAGWLPFTGAAPSSYYGNGTSASNYLFAAGSYTIDVIYARGSTLGDIAGSDTRWGTYDGVSNVQTNLNGVGALPFSFYSATSWGFFIDIQDGVGGTAFSGLGAGGRQAALFLGAGSNATSAGGVISPTGGNQTFYVGLEDKSCASNTGPGCSRASDFDNNDVLLRIRSVPEPSTYLLMASGLLGLGLAARRRRSV